MFIPLNPTVGGTGGQGFCRRTQNHNSRPCHRILISCSALGRAWAWRRRLESGEATTIHDIAKAEKVTDRFVSRIMRLAYLSPDVLERLVTWRDPPAVSVKDLINVTYLPWTEQMGLSFEAARVSPLPRL